MTRCLLTLVGVTAATLIGLSAGAADDPKVGPKLDPAMPYKARKAEPVTYDVDFSVVVTAPYHTKTLKVWLPIPPSDAAQEVKDSDLSTFPVAVKPKVGTEKEYGNTFAYFEFDHPEGAQIIRHKFKLTTWELNWDIDPKAIVKPTDWPAAFKPYLKADEAVKFDDPLAKFATDIVRDRKDATYDLDAVMGWLQENMTYDHSKASLSADAASAFKTRTGHCSDYHGLCSAFGRALGLPTRVTYGINAFPKNSPSHCKMEAYLPPYGWVSFDVSETQRLAQAVLKDKSLNDAEKKKLVAAVQDRLKRGFRDNTWYLQTRGTDYDLAPPATKKVKVVRTIYAEADGQPLPDPDPADPSKKEFAWMTVHQFKADRVVPYPFKDWKGLGVSEKK
jgi:transglutaminase-like putative cysteine protease